VSRAYCLADKDDQRPGRKAGASVWPDHDQTSAALVRIPSRVAAMEVRELHLPGPFDACARPYERPELVAAPMWVLQVAAPFAGRTLSPPEAPPVAPPPPAQAPAPPAAPAPALEGFL